MEYAKEGDNLWLALAFAHIRSSLRRDIHETFFSQVRDRMLADLREQNHEWSCGAPEEAKERGEGVILSFRHQLHGDSVQLCSWRGSQLYFGSPKKGNALLSGSEISALRDQVNGLQENAAWPWWCNVDGHDARCGGMTDLCEYHSEATRQTRVEGLTAQLLPPLLAMSQIISRR